jgi:hypothetical protein
MKPELIKLGMRKLIPIIVMVVILASCEADLQVYTDEFTPTPVIYCLINPVDSVHTIRLSKTIDASVSPASQKDDGNALVFPEASIKVKLVDYKGDTIVKNPEKVDDCIKDPGFFGNATHNLYRFTQVMDWSGVSLFNEIILEIDIPGMPRVIGKSDLLVRPRIRHPQVAAQYLFVDPTRPLLVMWNGAAWNEVDLKFDVIEQYRDSLVTQSYIFEERTNIIMTAGVCEIQFPYELFVQNMVRTLDPRKPVIRRYMGPVFIQVHTGNKEFAYYMDTKDGINDFSGQVISNLENAIGFLGCKLSFKWDTLYFDYFTRKRFEEDPALEGLKFREF